MNFTGERYIPGQGGAQIAYEHMHRYLYAMRWADGKQVLDLACGNGYGAALLACRARRVWALDLDDDTIQCARKDWHKDTISFIRGDATRLPFQNGSMDLVVAMEVLEHIKDQEELVSEISRVCGANGVALISTPNRAVYSEARQYANPFHVRELYLDDFVNLLKQHFSHVQIADQQIRAGSLLSCGTSESHSEVITEPTPGFEKPVAGPMYFLAVCSREILQDPVPKHSAYLDSTDGLFREMKQEMDQWVKSLEDAIGKRDQEIRDLQNRMAQEVELRDQTIRDLQDKMAHEVSLRDQAIRDLQGEMEKEIAIRDQQIVDIMNALRQRTREFDERGQWALSLQAEVERLTEIRRAFLYKVLSRLGLLPK